MTYWKDKVILDDLDEELNPKDEKHDGADMGIELELAKEEE
tara:strand:+ start:351 stop:473 length:123 start_codon:yes stop_codon:yes gene_type:complete